MKLIILFLFLFTSIGILEGQTAEEILLNTEDSYRKLLHYRDQGTFVVEYRTLPGYMDTTAYFLAMGRQGNVYHWFHKKKNGIMSGGLYMKSENDTLGTFTRVGTNDPGITCNMAEASARLGGRGGGMFYLFGSLFYPDFFSGTPGDSSAIQYYDKAKRLDDTTINNATCYVIKTRKTIIISKELADKENFKRDSTQGLLDLPPEQRGGPRREAGPQTSERKYYIRQSDLLLLRLEQFHFKDDIDTIHFKSTLVSNPQYNVSDIGTYPKE